MKMNEISRLLDELPEEMITEALEPVNGLHRKSIALRVLWAVSLFSAIIALFLCIRISDFNDKSPTGILTVTAYALGGNNTSVELQKEISLSSSYIWNPAVSIVPGLPLTLSVISENYATENIYFHIIASDGCFLRHEGPLDLPDSYKGETTQLPKEFTLSNTSTIYWRCWKTEDGEYIHFEGDIAYVDVIIYESNRIIGYAVLAISRLYSEEYGRTWSFSVSLIESIAIESGDQEITESYVRTQIEKVKSK